MPTTDSRHSHPHTVATARYDAAIEDGIDAALARAGGIVAAAASDAPWAVGLGAIRDALACGVLAGLAAYGWLVFA